MLKCRGVGQERCKIQQTRCQHCRRHWADLPTARGATKQPFPGPRATPAPLAGEANSQARFSFIKHKSKPFRETDKKSKSLKKQFPTLKESRGRGTSHVAKSVSFLFT